jgi:uncharacterized protein YdeI (YjbR/CyaY-like superfamily)
MATSRTRSPASTKTTSTASKAGTKSAPKALEHRGFETPRAFDRWLEKEHAESPGIWLVIAKKESGKRSITYAEALEVALVWGWIDGQKASKDETEWLQKFTPRGKKSIWSKVNREKVEVLIAEGRMKPSGLEVVRAAKADGRWEAAYDSPSRATVPDDLALALAVEPRAAAFFAVLDATNRYAVLHRVHTAKKAETRAARIRTFVEMLAREEAIYPDRLKKNVSKKA